MYIPTSQLLIVANLSLSMLRPSKTAAVKHHIGANSIIKSHLILSNSQNLQYPDGSEKSSAEAKGSSLFQPFSESLASERTPRACPETKRFIPASNRYYEALHANKIISKT